MYVFAGWRVGGQVACCASRPRPRFSKPPRWQSRPSQKPEAEPEYHARCKLLHTSLGSMFASLSVREAE
eukprot:2676366-Pleurochrysis_carterae.AAC.1